MGLSYYGFAFFIFLLLCIFAMLCRHLFIRNKGNVQSVLDEKEKKLLTLYSTMEDMMDEFNDTAMAASMEINRQIVEMRNIKPSMHQAAPAPAARATTPAIPMPAAAPPAMPTVPLPPIPVAPTEDAQPVAPPKPAAAPAFSQFEPPEATIDPKRPPDRPSHILSMHKQGMDRMHIAKQLSVTLSEVDLVLGIASQKR